MRLLLTFLLAFIGVSSYSQCTVSTTSSSNQVVCGDCVDLNAVGISGSAVLDNDFDNGTVGPGWTTTPGAAQFNNPCDPSIDGGTYLWMGSATSGARELQTADFDLSCGGQVCFYLDFATQGGTGDCEGPDLPDEGVYFQYSTDGGLTWTTIEYFGPNGIGDSTNNGGTNPQMTSWNQYCFTIPPGAQTTSTMFQWLQPGNSGTCCDHWGIDNVEIIANDCNYYYDWSHIPGSPDNQQQTVCPSSTTTYDVIYTNGINDTCTSSITIDLLLPDVTATANPATVSCGGCTQLDATLSNLPPDSCCYIIDMQDSFGDGWNGGSLEVGVNGAVVGTFAATGTGSTAQFCLADGDSFTLTYTSGSWEGENTYQLLDPSGNIIFQDGPNPTTGLVYSGTGNCGSAPITWSYQWTGPGITTPTSSSTQACPSTSGWYYVEVFDAANPSCSATDSVYVTVSNSVGAATFTTTPTLCVGNCDGTITITSPAGGGETYSVDGSIFQAGNIFNGLCSGNHTLSIIDANGCQIDTTFTITQPTLVDIQTTNIIDASCGASDGSITVQGSGGDGNYQYSIDNITYGANNQFTNLSSGSYVIYVQDGNGCVDSVTASISNLNGPVIDSTQFSDPTCFNICDGSIEIFASGGTPPYIVDIGNGPQSQTQFTNLCGGTYNIIVTDDNGCTANTSITLNSPPQLTMNFATFNASCNSQCDGSATVIPSGGVGTYTYTWTSSMNGTASENNLCAGTYTLTVEDDNGCQIDTTFIITEPTPFTVSVDSIVAADCGQPTGGVYLTVSGSTPPYTYLWDNGVTTQDNPNLSDGNYCITITDDNNCDTTICYTVPNNPAVVASIQSSIDASCNGSCDGEATAQPTGGTSPYTYSWNTTPIQTTQTATGLCAGTYEVIITDDVGCSDMVQVTITEPSIVTVSPDPDETICYGETTTICTNGSGGTGNLTYTWTPGNLTGNCITVNPTTTTTYSVQATDANGCQSSVETITVTVNPPLVINLPNVPDICPGESTSITANASGGNGGPYTFTWQPSGFVGQTNTVNPNQTETYQVIVSDGCSENDTGYVTVNVYTNPPVDITASDYEGCEPLTITFYNNVGGGSNCEWVIDGQTFNDCDSVTYTFENDGSYDISFSMNTSDGCNIDSTYTDMVTVHPLPIADFNASPQPADILDPEVIFDNLSIGGSTFDWDFGDGNYSTDINPIHEYDSVGTYQVELIVTTDFGCQDTTSLTVVIDDVFSIYVPNAFSPDNDGVNEIFRPVIKNVDHYEMYIFNRWGQLIFQGQVWDGTYLGVMSKTDVYVWKIVTHTGPKKKEFYGHVTLLK